MNLKIVSWNCHYGLTDEKVDKLLEKNGCGYLCYSRM